MQLTRAGLLGLLICLAVIVAEPEGQEAADKSPIPKLVLHLRWDAAAKRSSMELVAHFPIQTLEALAARLRPIAREHVNPRHDFSEVPIRIVADQEGPFREIQKAMQVCARPEVNIYRVALEATEPSRSDRAIPARAEDPPSRPGAFIIGLTMRDGRCRCTTNGWPIGDWPEARAVLGLQLLRATSLGTPAAISVGDEVPRMVVNAVADFVAEQESYRLHMTPTFTVGDVEVRRMSFSRKRSIFGLPDRKLEDSRSVSDIEHRRTEVLEVDADRKPVLLRLHIVSSRRTWRVTTPAEERGKSTTVLKDIRFLLRREGALFRPDPDSVTAPEGTKLTEMQARLLREYLEGPEQISSWRPHVALLHPTRPVKLQEYWSPSPASLEEYERLEPRLVATGSRVTRAEFKLLRVADGVATIDGRMCLAGTRDGVTVTDDWRGPSDLDLGTGRWAGWTRRAKIVVEAKDYRSMAWLESKGTMKSVPGHGTASKLPGGIERITLPDPAPEPDPTPEPEAPKGSAGG